MGIARKVFNIYLPILLLLSLVAGCQSPEMKAKRRLTVLNLYLESRNLPDREDRVSISRDHPFSLSIEKSPFLTHNDIDQAKVIEVPGGFAIRLQFVREAALILEQYSSNNPGKHMAIFCEFSVPLREKVKETRWLAAPRINKRIVDGVVIFTPDATREEADEIVLGLNNVARQLKSLLPNWHAD